MKSPTFLRRLSRPRYWLLLRRVHGASMTPLLPPGKLVVATCLYWRLQPGDVVIVNHEGLDKIKRIQKLADNQMYLTGDNPLSSTDSRHFGWVPVEHVAAKVLGGRNVRLVKNA